MCLPHRTSPLALSMITQIPQSMLIVPLLLLHPVPDVLLRAAPMRDYTGFDSLLSPLFCLVVMVSVWALERCMPGRDILLFIRKSWRDTQPLYQLSDDQALEETRADMMMPDTSNKDPAAAPAVLRVTAAQLLQLARSHHLPIARCT